MPQQNSFAPLSIVAHRRFINNFATRNEISCKLLIDKISSPSSDACLSRLGKIKIDITGTFVNKNSGAFFVVKHSTLTPTLNEVLPITQFFCISKPRPLLTPGHILQLTPLCYATCHSPPSKAIECLHSKMAALASCIHPCRACSMLDSSRLSMSWASRL